uniref:Uncharacterized protein n=1 Tax=Rhizophora mucronata TaxID=61149 RepID=A0A2P2QHA1_RHIMU
MKSAFLLLSTIM